MIDRRLQQVLALAFVALWLGHGIRGAEPPALPAISLQNQGIDQSESTSSSTALTPQQISASKFPRDQWGAPMIEVFHDAAAAKWTIQGKKQTVVFHEKDLSIEVTATSAHWNMVASGNRDLLLKSGGVETHLRLASAGKMVVASYDTGFKTGIKINLNNWHVKQGVVSLPLCLTVALEGHDEDLVFDIAADERDAIVRQLDWPTAMDARDVDFTVLSNGRGVLLPRAWAKPYHPIKAANLDGSLKTSDLSEVQSHVIECWSMSWWGFQKGKAAMMVIVETPDDAAYQFEHPAGGPTVIGPRWRESLGQLRYPRSCRMCFLDQGNYVDLAKRYRRYVIDSGLFVSLKEKIARQPSVKELIGTPQTRLGILTNIKSDSLHYNKEDPTANRRLTTFDERAEQLRRWKQQGLDRLCVVLTGWPREGYDRQHPDELPPAPAAGGWEGMRRLADVCKQLSYTFSLHDQYRDYYVDAPSYDPQFAIHEEDATWPPHDFPGTRFGTWKQGQVPFMNNWEGGTQTFLNNRFMPGHLVKNYEALFDHGIHPQGVYLDVFGYVPPDEDFNPEHPCTRTEAMRARALCYNWSRSHLGFVGTEAGCDWTVPYVDCVSAMRSAKLIPVPLYNLVYHDAVMMSYGADDLYGFLNGGSPNLGRDQETSTDAMAAVRRMSELHQRVALQELVKHEFLDPKFRKERSIFADGTIVTVDWDAKTADIEPELDGPPSK